MKTHDNKLGHLVISIDFELFWGVRDSRSLSGYGNNIAGVHTAIPKMLALFDKYQVKATFAIVGFLFFKDKAALLQGLPSDQPTYTNQQLSPYAGYIANLGNDAATQQYHFAPALIQAIQARGQHEIGTHTFSHYYCLEPGQTRGQFAADLQAAKQVAQAQQLALNSLVFPRNQYNQSYLQACYEAGIRVVRGNQSNWLYRAQDEGAEPLLRRAFRLADSYINISGFNGVRPRDLGDQMPVDLPASRFLRPYNRKLRALEGLRLRRIKTEMEKAARNGDVYHLWWHPHNFGVQQDENFAFLENVLVHYQGLKTSFGFASATMGDFAKNAHSPSVAAQFDHAHA